jgi:hypothetical protein
MVTQLEVVHGNRRRQIQAAATRDVRRLWAQLRSFDEREMDWFVSNATATQLAALSALLSEQDAYFALSLTARGVTTSPVGFDPADYRRPVPPEVEWQRPFTHMRTRLSEGAEFGPAAAFGLFHAERTMATDLQIAARNMARDWLNGNARVVGFARVLGSGGASGENCGLCVVASTQRYHKGELMPIHDHCTCEVMPILDTERPEQLLDPHNLDAAYDQLTTETGAPTSQVRNDLRRIRFDASELPRPRVVHHGELGPVIYDARHSFATL